LGCCPVKSKHKISLRERKYNLARQSLLDQGYAICENKYCDLLKGETSFFYRTFYARTEYKIVAISDDNDVTDVDLLVYYNDGSLYFKDTDDTSIGVVTFILSESKFLKVVFKNYASSTPDYRSTIRVLVGYR
jgi:hypothetical protein